MIQDKIHGFSAVNAMLEIVLDGLTSPVVFCGKEHIGKYTLTVAIANRMVSVVDNIHVLSLQDGKTQISIEQVRTLLDDIKLLPYGSDKYRVVIIDGAQYLNSVSENALLKLLEEPPAYVRLFVLVDSLSNLLPTIKSRCSIVNLYHTEQDVDEVYQSLSVDNELKEFLRRVYDDQIGKVLIADNPEEQDRIQLQRRIVTSLRTLKNRADILTYQTMFLKAGAIETVKMAYLYYRSKIQPDACKTYEAYIMLYLLEALTSLSKGLNEKLVIDALLIDICALNKKWS